MAAHTTRAVSHYSPTYAYTLLYMVRTFLDEVHVAAAEHIAKVLDWLHGTYLVRAASNDRLR